MLPLDRARRFYAAYGWRSGILVAGVALVVAVHLAERDRSKGPEPVHHDRDPDAFREIVNRPDVYTLDVHVPEQQHIDGTDAFIPTTRSATTDVSSPWRTPRSRSTAGATP